MAYAPYAACEIGYQHLCNGLSISVAICVESTSNQAFLLIAANHRPGYTGAFSVAQGIAAAKITGSAPELSCGSTTLLEERGGNLPPDMFDFSNKLKNRIWYNSYGVSPSKIVLS